MIQTKPKVTAIIQARMGSTRLPGKVLMEVSSGKTVLAAMIERIQNSETVNRFIIATTDSAIDRQIGTEAKKLGVEFYQASCLEDDVLGRFVMAAQQFDAQHIVRLCADSPLHHKEIIDECVKKYLSQIPNVDIVTNLRPETFPYGTAVEVFSIETLLRLDKLSTQKEVREHVTQFFHKNPEMFRHSNVSHTRDLSALRWVVDTMDDLKNVRKIFADTKSVHPSSSWLELLEDRRNQQP